MPEGYRAAARGGTVTRTADFLGSIRFDEVGPDEWQDVAIGWLTCWVTKHALGMICGSDQAGVLCLAAWC